MNKNCKKGFTIVELIIVIAVIAILAAVLIPTFSNLIKRANVANDTALVRNLNTALAADGAKQHDTMREALAAANAFGYDVSKINAKADGNEILWDSYNDCFVYKDESGINYIPDSQIKGEAGKGAQLWHIANKGTSDISSEYSNYLGEGTYAGKLEIKTGLDVGDHTEVTEVEYTGNGKDVIFYMNGGKLTVNDNSAAQQYFYGSASQADITTGTSCFHVYGAIAKTEVKVGKVVVENGGMVIVSAAAASASVEKNGGIVLKASGVTSFDGNVALSTEEEKAAYALEISTAAELASFRDRVNAGMTYEGLTVKLTANIDLNNTNWLPIGNYRQSNSFGKHTFNGTFDGQNHTISGLYINGEYYPAEYKEEKSIYGALFGYIENATLKNFTVKGTVIGTDVAGVVGALGANSTVENVISDVNLTGKDGKNAEGEVRGKVAGIVACLKGDNAKISNCINKGNLSATDGGGNPAGGIIAYIDNEGLKIENCKNYGAINAEDTSDVGGILGSSHKQVAIIGCGNYANVSGKTNVGGIAGNVGGSIANCENTGKITIVGNGKDGAVGGIVGTVGWGNSTIEACKNSGVVSAAGTPAGGIVGWAYYSTGVEYTITLVKCENTGDINGQEGIVGQIIGGVWHKYGENVGYLATLTECKATEGKALVGDKSQNYCTIN